jgi:hypothetical protein
MSFDFMHLVSPIATSALVSGAIGFLFKSWIGSISDAKLETLKAQLKAEADIRLLQLTHEFQKSTAEHQTRYTILQEKRATMIADTHAELAALLDVLTRFTYASTYDPEPTEEENEFFKQIETFRRSFRLRTLYFPIEVVSSIETLLASINFSGTAFGLRLKTEEQSYDKNDRNNKWLELMHDVETHMKPAMDKLAEEGRKLLGSSI